MTIDTSSARFRDKVRATQAEVRQMLHAFAELDLSSLHELDVRLKADSRLLEEFIANPTAVIHRETSFRGPPGIHYHFINDQNEYFPPEGSAIDQLRMKGSEDVWARLEIRVAVGPGCIAGCGICNNKLAPSPSPSLPP
jgi:hypothetical protein